MATGDPPGLLELRDNTGAESGMLRENSEQGQGAGETARGSEGMDDNNDSDNDGGLRFLSVIDWSPTSCDQLAVGFRGGRPPYTVTAVWYSTNRDNGYYKSSVLVEKTWAEWTAWTGEPRSGNFKKKDAKADAKRPFSDASTDTPRLLSFLVGLAVLAQPKDILIFQLTDASGLTINSPSPITVSSNGKGQAMDNWCISPSVSVVDPSGHGQLVASVPPMTDTVLHTTTTTATATATVTAISTIKKTTTAAAPAAYADGNSVSSDVAHPGTSGTLATMSTAPLLSTEGTATKANDLETATCVLVSPFSCSRSADYNYNSGRAVENAEIHDGKVIQSVLAGLLALACIAIIFLSIMYWRTNRRYRRVQQEYGVIKPANKPAKRGVFARKSQGASDDMQQVSTAATSGALHGRPYPQAGYANFETSENLLDGDRTDMLQPTLLPLSSKLHKTKRAGDGARLGADGTTDDPFADNQASSSPYGLSRADSQTTDPARLSAVSLISGSSQSSAPTTSTASAGANSAYSTEFYSTTKASTIPVRDPSAAGTGTGTQLRLNTQFNALPSGQYTSPLTSSPGQQTLRGVNDGPAASPSSALGSATLVGSRNPYLRMYKPSFSSFTGSPSTSNNGPSPPSAATSRFPLLWNRREDALSEEGSERFSDTEETESDRTNDGDNGTVGAEGEDDSSRMTTVTRTLSGASSSADSRYYFGRSDESSDGASFSNVSFNDDTPGQQ
ncbi:hypothetical protein EMMF5_006065 [Cystobasidiomycetes sp. EMM_F5]